MYVLYTICEELQVLKLASLTGISMCLFQPGAMVHCPQQLHRTSLPRGVRPGCLPRAVLQVCTQLFEERCAFMSDWQLRTQEYLCLLPILAERNSFYLIITLNIKARWLECFSAFQGGLAQAISMMAQPTLHTSQLLPYCWPLST